ncbi:MAG: hypothetical protein ACON4M_03015 [Crocinitomicaceae bacterium]
MSLETIEMIIRESLRDGEFTAQEREVILKQAEKFGISKETVEAIIKTEIENFNSKIKQKEDKSKQKIDYEKEEYWRYKWSEFFGDQSENWISISMLVFALLGIINAYTHNKAWYSFIGMFFLFSIYGFVFYSFTFLISMLTKRVPFLDWPKTTFLTFSVVVLVFILYSVIPF